MEDRDEWIRAEQARQAAAGNASGFDAKAVETIRSQAVEKSIVYRVPVAGWPSSVGYSRCPRARSDS